MKRAAWLVPILLAGLAEAHIGSPDVFLQGSAGPYPVFVTIRPPTVIPGVAEIEVRCSSPAIREIRVTPTPLTGTGAKFAPTPDLLKRASDDPQFFTGSLWMMAPGSWEVHVRAEGQQGRGELAVPLPAIATRTKPMQAALGAFLFVMMIVLAAGLVSIVGAGSREGQLAPGAAPDRGRRLRARILMGATAALVCLILWGGGHWWTAEAKSYAENLYKPIAMSATVEGHDQLVLRLKDPEWALPRETDDFLPDHGHLMHLYVFREPDFDHVWHLHPELQSTGDIAPVSSRVDPVAGVKVRMAASSAVFIENLPPMPAGKYQLYGDVVHSSGFPDTLVASFTLDRAIAGTPLQGDDSGGVPGQPAGGAHIIWDHDASPIHAGRADGFKFRLVDPDGQPVSDTELYMGMLGHAAFVKDDGTVFAHVHPSGSVPMAALELANPQPMDHAAMHMDSALPPEVVFPYGFPTPGDYRVVVQMKHSGVVETGVFQAKVIQ